MAGVSRRQVGGKYRIWYTDERGNRKFATGHTDKKASLDLANRLEQQSRLEREGLAEPGERHRRAAAGKPLADHAEDWRLNMLAKHDTPRHAQHMAGAATRLLADAGIAQLADLSADLLQGALGRLRAKRSPRTANHALTAVKAFVRWLHDANRLRDLPRGVLGLDQFTEAVDRRRVRRPLTPDELDRLYAVAEGAPDVFVYGATRSKIHKTAVTGAERALVYRLAAGTGFRAAEIRSLRVKSFDLGPAPAVTVEAGYSKNRQTAHQPVGPKLAAALAAWLGGKDPDALAFTVPDRTGDMIAADLKRAGVPVKTEAGVVDFHSLRHTFVTRVVDSGATVKQAQTLARHSTPTLTIGRYAHAGESDLRKILEGD